MLIIGGHTQRCTDTSDGQILYQMQVYVCGGTASNVIVQKVKDNRCNVRSYKRSILPASKKIKMHKHRAVLGLKRRDDDDA